MKQLDKVKMQQVLKEIEEDEELKASQQFYGQEAFNTWLRWVVAMFEIRPIHHVPRPVKLVLIVFLKDKLVLVFYGDGFQLLMLSQLRNDRKYEYIDGLVQERHNSSVLAMDFCLSCIIPSILSYVS